MSFPLSLTKAFCRNIVLLGCHYYFLFLLFYSGVSSLSLTLFYFANSSQAPPSTNIEMFPDLRQSLLLLFATKASKLKTMLGLLRLSETIENSF